MCSHIPHGWLTSTAIKAVIDEAGGNTDAEMLMNDMLWYADGSLPHNMTIITGTDGAIQGKDNLGGRFNSTQCHRLHDVTEDMEKLFTWYAYRQ